MALKVRRTRRQTKGRYKLHKPEWVDPFPHIPGTEPEKRIFALLVQMKVYFIFQGQIPEFEEGGKYAQMAPPDYKPDFVLPEYKLIIDPFSPFHHSLEDAVKRDRYKVVAYNVAGYAYYHPWALGGNRWSWSQYHNKSKMVETGRRTIQYAVNSSGKRIGWEKVYRTQAGKLVTKDGKPVRVGKEEVVDRVRLYQGVNADKNSYRGLNRNLSGQVMSTHEMLQRIPELQMGPRYKLTDPRDIKAKRNPGYRLGPYLGAGAKSVGAANARRRRPPLLSLSAGQRRSLRRARGSP